MASLLVPVLLPLGYLFLWPLVDRALKPQTNDSDGEALASPLQTVLTALALSVGLLTVALFWLGILPGQLITPLAALAVVLSGFVLGLAVNPTWFAPRCWLNYWRRQWRALARLDASALLTLALLLALMVILANALYYPFIGEDVLIRYGLQAQTIARAHRLPGSVVGYPPLVPLSIVSTWFAAGGPNEHLARAFAAVMAAGTLGATYLAGRQAFGHIPGLVSAALVGLAPMFVNNATVLYTDIPTTFPLTLAFLYVLRWWEYARTHDAVLAGVLAGIALFTKQSALIWLAGLAAVPVLWLFSSRRTVTGNAWRAALRGWTGMLLPPILVAGPWYARNLLLGSELLPMPGLYHLLAPGGGPLGLVPPLTAPLSFNPLLVVALTAGWLSGFYLMGLQLWHILHTARGSQPDTSPPLELLAGLFVVPYWLAWWTRFSFDVRFLLLILPLMALWSLRPLLWLAEVIPGRIELPRLAWQGLGASLLIVSLLIGVKDRLGGVYWTVADPFASHETRLHRSKASLADIVTYAQTQLDPSTDRLYLMDERLPYYLSEFEYRVGYPHTLSELEGCDYLFHSSGMFSVYGEGLLGWDDSEFYLHAFNPLIFEPVYESGGVHVMRILRTSLPAETEEW